MVNLKRSYRISEYRFIIDLTFLSSKVEGNRYNCMPNLVLGWVGLSHELLFYADFDVISFRLRFRVEKI